MDSKAQPVELQCREKTGTGWRKAGRKKEWVCLSAPGVRLLAPGISALSSGNRVIILAVAAG